ncbi:hypothetical protein [Streptomyces sp. CA2R106]|uniref:hypothetical protein n=1 Tax=Streptomyces sp. CA2R106 TaxID=3120153 RepID=UPI00300AD915
MTGTETETAVDTVIDRYAGLSDRAVHDDSALEELLAWFAAEAAVRVGPEPVRGLQAVAPPLILCSEI